METSCHHQPTNNINHLGKKCFHGFLVEATDLHFQSFLGRKKKISKIELKQAAFFNAPFSCCCPSYAYELKRVQKTAVILAF